MDFKTLISPLQRPKYRIFVAIVYFQMQMKFLFFYFCKSFFDNSCKLSGCFVNRSDIFCKYNRGTEIRPSGLCFFLSCKQFKLRVIVKLNSVISSKVNPINTHPINIINPINKSKISSLGSKSHFYQKHVLCRSIIQNGYLCIL